jgi:hypothetical protein
MALVDEADDSDEDMVWETRVRLLDIVDKEALFRSAGAHIGNEAEAILRRSGNIAIEAVPSASQGAFYLYATSFGVSNYFVQAMKQDGLSSP